MQRATDTDTTPKTDEDALERAYDACVSAEELLVGLQFVVDKLGNESLHLPPDLLSVILDAIASRAGKTGEMLDQYLHKGRPRIRPAA